MTASAAPATVEGVPVATIIARLRTRKPASVASELGLSVRAVHIALQLYRRNRAAVDAEIEEGP